MKALSPFALLLLILPFCFAAEREMRVAEYRVTLTVESDAPRAFFRARIEP